jgi:filamentous hemagglutinin
MSSAIVCGLEIYLGKDAIANGESVAGRGGSTIHYSPENHISVVVGGNGRVVTVGYGRFTP